MTSTTTCSRAIEFLEATIGDTLGPEDALPADSAPLRVHVAHCGPCSAAKDEIRRGIAAAEAVFAPDPAGDAALVAAVRSRLPRGRVLMARWSWLSATAAAVVLCALGYQAASAWRATRSVGSGDVLVANVGRAPAAAGLVPGYAGPHFVDVTDGSSIGEIDHTGIEGTKDWMVEMVGHGAAVLDMDGDGDLDLFVPDGNRLDPAHQVHDTWRLYRNDGGMHFTDVTKDSGLACDAWACGAVAGDLNGDGMPDLYVPCFGLNHLFMNRVGGRFEDVTEKAGVAGLDSEWSTAAALADFDGDGRLDIFVSNYADMRGFMSEPTGLGPRGCKWHGMAVGCGPRPLTPQQDRLFLNRGDGSFIDATASNLPRAKRYSFQCVVLDLNGDGAPDIFVAADTHPNLLLLNDGHGHFTDQALVAGVATDGQGREQACMGVATGDVDGDGLTDIFVTNFSHEPNVLYRGSSGRGVPRFADVTAAAGLVELEALLGWGASLFDFDCDGALDVMFANGHLYPGIEEAVPTTSYEQPLSLYGNDGTGRFHEITASAGTALCVPRVNRGLVVADFDDDGRLDAFVTVLNGGAHLLHNDGRGAGHSLQLLLRRADGHVEGAGAHVVATVRGAGGDRRLSRDLLLGSSFASSEDPRLHFGLGEAARVELIEVHWPFGATQHFGPLPAGGLYEIVENRPEPKRLR